MCFVQTVGILRRLACPRIYNTQQLWTYVGIAFNKVDPFRLEQVGPDRLCAEWILKNGGAVSFVQAPGKFLKDYNALPPENVKLKLKEIDATEATVMKIGLEHFKNCQYIDRVIFHNCSHLEDDGLTFLPHIKDTLLHLEVSSCHNINKDGLMVLKNMTNLKTLVMFDMRLVKDLSKVVSELQPLLPQCTIKTTKL